MELPTYTNIWRIEKRLYKLYDFRLPMPLPVGQIAVFAAIAVPYVVALTLLGLSFSHTLLWLYVLPPGVLAWLATRPVLESKRLHELIISQVRYLGEPRTWCRMAPLVEKDEITLTGRVWRRAEQKPATVAEQSVVPIAVPARSADPVAVPARSAVPAAARDAVPPSQAIPAPAGRKAAVTARQRVPAAGRHAAASRAGLARPAPAKWPAATTPPPSAAPAQVPVVPATPARVRATPARVRAVAAQVPATPARVPAVAAQVPAAVQARSSALPLPAQPPAAPSQTTAVPVAAAQAPASVPQISPVPIVAAPPLADLPPLSARRPVAPPPPADVAPPPSDVAPPPSDVAPPPSDVAPPPSDVAAHTPPAGPAQNVPSTPVPQPPPAPPAERPVVTVTGEPAPGRPLRVVERALNGSSANRGDGWRDHVVVVPGGHRPGRPDQQQRDRARAQLPVAGPCRIVVLGCTVGAGQTVTTLMTGEVLASLRTDQVAVLDLNPGSGSLAERARTAPAVSQDASRAGRTPGPTRGGGRPHSRLEVIARSAADAQAEHAEDDVRKVFELVSARYPLTLADPAPAAVPRVLAVADQLVLVAPASADAASAIAMTYEWLEAHGRAGLAAAAITVLNGVSRHTMRHVEQAEAVARGRCRAIVRVPWDDQLQNPASERTRPPTAAPPQRPAGALLSPAAVHAYTALAGLLIAGLADAPELRRARI